MAEDTTLDTGTVTPAAKPNPDEKEEKTYTRDELNKIINAEKNNLKASIEKEFTEKQNEADKLAKMDAEQKMKYNLKKYEAEKQEALSKLQSYELKEEAIKIAKEKQMDISLLDMLDYSKETAETVSLKMEKLDLTFKKAVENAVRDALKENSPRQVLNSGSAGTTRVSRSSF